MMRAPQRGPFAVKKGGTRFELSVKGIMDTFHEETFVVATLICSFLLFFFWLELGQDDRAHAQSHFYLRCYNTTAHAHARIR